MPGVQSPAEAKDFSSRLYVQTTSEAHPAFYPIGTRDSFPRGKVQPGRDADHLPPSTAEVKNGQELYHLSPLAPTWHKQDTFTFTLLN
jgi:hypothetical protein